MLPAGLPGYETFDPSQDSVPSEKGVGACVVLTMPELQLHFRLHDYFMGIFSHYTNRYAMWHANDKFRDVAESGHDLRVQSRKNVRKDYSWFRVIATKRKTS